MPENSGETPLPPQETQPQQPVKRRWLRAIVGSLAVLGGAKAVSVAAQTKTGQDILKSAPWNTPPERPSPYQMKKEIDQGLDELEKGNSNAFPKPSQNPK